MYVQSGAVRVSWIAVVQHEYNSAFARIIRSTISCSIFLAMQTIVMLKLSNYLSQSSLNLFDVTEKCAFKVSIFSAPSGPLRHHQARFGFNSKGCGKN